MRIPSKRKEFSRSDGSTLMLGAESRSMGEEETRLAGLRAALVEGEESGPATPFNMDDFIAEKRRDGGR